MHNAQRKPKTLDAFIEKAIFEILNIQVDNDVGINVKLFTYHPLSFVFVLTIMLNLNVSKKAYWWKTNTHGVRWGKQNTQKGKKMQSLLVEERLKELCVHNKPQTTKKSCGPVLRCFVANC